MDSCQALKRKIKLYEASDKTFLIENIYLEAANPESDALITLSYRKFSWVALPPRYGYTEISYKTPQKPGKRCFCLWKKDVPIHG
jgi:hypothetical protein